MKKLPIFAFAALSIGALSGLTSCGGNPIVDDKTDVSKPILVWAPAEEEQVIKAVIKEYNDKQTKETAKFNIEYQPVSEADGGPTLSKDPNVGGALVAVADDHISSLVEKETIWTLQGNIEKYTKEENASIAIEAASIDKKLYGFPISNDNGYFLWYNKDKISDEQAKSVEGLIAATKNADGTYKKDMKILFDLPNGFYSAAPFFSSEVCGTKSLSYHHEKVEGKTAVKYSVNWDNPKGAAAAESLSKLLVPEYKAKNWVTGGNDVIAAGFTDDSMCAAVSGLWMEKELSKLIGADKLGAIKLPTFKIAGKDAQLGSFAGTKLYVVNSTKPVAEQKAAIYLARLLTSKDAQLKRFELRNAIPTNLEALKVDSYKKNTTAGQKALLAQSEFAAVQSLSAEGKYWDIGKGIGQAIIDGKLVKDEHTNYATWTEFLKSQLDKLR
ncbi:MAG: extracellular solute-binding protein [Bacilli bacterium]